MAERGGVCCQNDDDDDKVEGYGWDAFGWRFCQTAGENQIIFLMGGICSMGWMLVVMCTKGICRYPFHTGIFALH